MSDPYALPFTRDHLTDGYISYTFGSRNAESNIVRLFQVVAPFIRAIRHWSGAFYVLNQPSQYSPPALSVYGRNAWLLDYAVRSGGSVVPQQLRFPQNQGDRHRYVDQVQFSMPVFFVNTDENLGVPVMDAVAGRMQLLGADLPPQLADKTTIKIRIGVCTRSFTARSSSLIVCIAVARLCALRTPDRTERPDPREKSHYPRELCQTCGNLRTTIFGGAFVPKVTMDSEIELFLGLRARSCASSDIELDYWTWQYHLRGSETHRPRPSLRGKLDAHPPVDETNCQVNRSDQVSWDGHSRKSLPSARGATCIYVGVFETTG